MANKTKNKKPPSVISFRALAEKSGVPYSKVRNNVKGVYNSLDHLDKTKLMNAFYNEVTPFLKQIGFHIEITRIKDSAPQ